MITSTYDAATGEITIDTSDARPTYGDIAACIARYGQRIDLSRVSFGATVKVNGGPTLDVSWPPEGVRYRQTDQDVVEVIRARWQPDDAVIIATWVETRAGRVTGQASFTAPRPVQPYPSWTWTAGQWTPPEPYPESGDWTWDEATLSWVPE